MLRKVLVRRHFGIYGSCLEKVTAPAAAAEHYIAPVGENRKSVTETSAKDARLFEFAKVFRDIQLHWATLRGHSAAADVVSKEAQVLKRPLAKRVYAFMEQISHLDELRRSQEHVMLVQRELAEASNQKRSLLRQLDLVRDDLGMVFMRVKYTKDRTSPEHLQLVEEELAIYKREKALQEAIAKVDTEEQELLSELPIALKASNDTEKMHTNFIKVLGVICTLLGSFLTAVISIIGLLHNEQKFHILKRDVEDSLMHGVKRIENELNLRLENVRRNEPPPTRPASKSTESWGSYLNRHTRWTYSWALPKK